MSLPERVEGALGDETAVARIALGGEDELIATQTRTLVYRAEGLLSDESIEEFPHDAERIEVAEGRRKAKVTLDYGLDGERTVVIPSKRLDDALLAVVDGVFDAAGITDGDERVERVFRFSELTLAVTSARLVRHIGASLWDEEYEEYRFDDVTDLAFEEGSVATTVVVALGDRQERFKTPNDSAREVRETLESALFAHHDVESVAELRATVADAGADENADPIEGATEDALSFGDGPDPLSAEPVELAEEPTNATRNADAETPAESSPRDADTESNAAVVESASENGNATDDPGTTREAGFEFESPDPEPSNAGDVAAELAALREAVEAQSERLRRQETLVERLIEELRHGR